MKKRNAYQVRLKLKSRIEGVTVKPSYLTGIVITDNKTNAGNYAVAKTREWLNGKGEQVDVSLGIVKSIPSSFLLSQED
ncbi:hypothetical protein PG279_04605 [Riemerella anatipestifer]|nr:hypothetical protein [Riemerella anatipestifer]